MYKVLLVDDEAFARIGLRDTFDWEGNGFVLIGEAANGKSAMKWIERGEVDILITDIAMPVMDGLELMRAARERCPWIKIVLLSCHSDFAFVREGMRMGASDYLLKPTLEPADLKEVLDKVKLQIEEDRKISEMYVQQELTGRRIELERTFARLLTGEAGEAGAAASPPWLAGGFRAVVCLLDGAAALLSEEGGIYVEMVIEEAQDSFYEWAGEGVAFRGHADQLIAVMPAREEDEAAFVDQLKAYRDLLEGRGFSFTMGISGMYSGAGEVKQAIREGREAAKLRFFRGPGGIHRRRQALRPDAGKAEAAACLWMQLRQAVEDRRREDAAACLGELMQHWTEHDRSPAEVKREAQDALALFDAGRTVPLERIETLRGMETADEVRGLVQAAFDELWRTGEKEEDKGLHRRIVAKAIEYMKENYSRNISLQDVADHVAISKNYFSELFKKNTGQTFIDYLIRLRLSHASELLRTTTLKIYEIAEMSGFNDVKYFSKVFKKVMKVSPAEYREGRNG